MILASELIQSTSLFEPQASVDEIMRNLAPPLAVGLVTLAAWRWARGAHRRARTRARREAHPAE